MSDTAVRDDVAVLGTGAIGTAVVRELRAAGVPVVVWNRTPDRVRAAVDLGARAVAHPREALAADVAVLALTDGQAVHEVLDAAGPALDGSTVVALGTVAPDEAAAAAELVERAGGHYLGVGLQHGPEDLGRPTTQLPAGGGAAALDRARPVLERLGSIRHVGTAPEAAAVWSFALFGAWYDAQLGVLRALEHVRSVGGDVAELARDLQGQLQHVVDGAPAVAAELTDGHHPAGPADLGQHAAVIDVLTRLRSTSVLGDGGLAAVRRRLAQQVAAGRGDAGLTALLAGSG